MTPGRCGLSLAISFCTNSSTLVFTLSSRWKLGAFQLPTMAGVSLTFLISVRMGPLLVPVGGFALAAAQRLGLFGPPDAATTQAAFGFRLWHEAQCYTTGVHCQGRFIPVRWRVEIR